MLLYGCPAGRQCISAACPALFVCGGDHSFLPLAPLAPLASLALLALLTPTPPASGSSGARWGVSINFPYQSKWVEWATIGFQLIFFVGPQWDVGIYLDLCLCVVGSNKVLFMFKPKIAIPGAGTKIRTNTYSICKILQTITFSFFFPLLRQLNKTK